MHCKCRATKNKHLTCVAMFYNTTPQGFGILDDTFIHKLCILKKETYCQAKEIAIFTDFLDMGNLYW